jgi:hypothetical protein
MIDFSIVENSRDIPVVTFWRQNEFQKLERRTEISLLVVEVGYASLLLHMISFLRRKLLIRLAAFFYFFLTSISALEAIRRRSRSCVAPAEQNAGPRHPHSMNDRQEVALSKRRHHPKSLRLACSARGEQGRLPQ